MERVGSSDDSDLECRVCRCGPDSDRLLYSPCLCSGSIGLVHQDCLETWLNHSSKEKCELCGFKYQFSPQYAASTPKSLPLHILFFTLMNKLFSDYIPWGVHFLFAGFIWLGVVPFFTCQLYRIWMKFDTFTLATLFQRLQKDTITGFVLTAFIVLTFVVMVRF